MRRRSAVGKERPLSESARLGNAIAGLPRRGSEGPPRSHRPRNKCAGCAATSTCCGLRCQAQGLDRRRVCSRRNAPLHTDRGLNVQPTHPQREQSKSPAVKIPGANPLSSIVSFLLLNPGGNVSPRSSLASGMVFGTHLGGSSEASSKGRATP